MFRSGNDLLFEAIQIRDGIPQRLDLHEARMDHSRVQLFGSKDTISLEKLIDVPEDMRNGIVKCRIVYGESVDSITYSRYVPRVHDGVAIAPVEVEFDYAFKYALRQRLNDLEDRYPGKAVIISFDGILTDATYANIALYDGSRWLTPKHYLLNGVMRQWLLARGIIEEAEIHESDLSRFSSLRLMNAMLEWEESPILPLHQDHFH